MKTNCLANYCDCGILLFHAFHASHTFHASHAFHAFHASHASHSSHASQSIYLSIYISTFVNWYTAVSAIVVKQINQQKKTLNKLSCH
jgi:hypothetical protein